MSEKTPGEVAKWTFWDTKRATHVYADPDKREKDAWQAAADAIAAPLLARIAELEGEVERLTARVEECRRELGNCLRRERDLKSARDRAEGEVVKAQKANAHLKSELLLSRKGFEAVDQMRVEALSDAEAAYQRGAAEERERWKNAAISEKAKYGVDHDFNCGARTACDNILDVWRSASPAVDVTSDKGGER